MAGSPTKKGNWGTWAVIDNPPPKEGSQCGGCINYNEDGSCNVLPVIIHEVGKDYWKRCKQYTKRRPIVNPASLDNHALTVACIKKMGIERIDQFTYIVP